jgi:hypothetical protein
MGTHLRPEALQIVNLLFYIDMVVLRLLWGQVLVKAALFLWPGITAGTKMGQGGGPNVGVEG